MDLTARCDIPNLELNDLINRLVKTEDPEEVRQLYRQWSETYDRDLEDFGYVAPKIGTAILQQLVTDHGSLIHDAGCGTGQVGQLLSSSGYSNIHGSDFSEDMLGVAKSRDCYCSLVQADYSQPLQFKSESVNGIISIGVYRKSFKDVFISEMLRILKPGGCMVFSCRPVYFEEVSDSVKALHVDLRLSKSSVVFDDYMLGQKASAYYFSLHKPKL